MLHIKLSDRTPADHDDPLDRAWWGYDASAPTEILFANNRGRWVLGPRAGREQYAAFSYTGDHTVKFVAEIDGIEKVDGGRRALIGRALDPDHPIARRWVGAPAPDGHRNPTTYFVDPESEPPTCSCGCGEPVPPNRAFAPGHDQKAIHERITRQWGGTLGFMKWFDSTYPEA
jgi:hypothetical protein